MQKSRPLRQKFYRGLRPARLFIALQGKVWYDGFDNDIEKEFGLDQLTLWDKPEDKGLV